MIKAIKKFFNPTPARVYVLVLLQRRQKLYFSNMRKKEVNFCTLWASAWWCHSKEEAQVLRKRLSIVHPAYDNLRIETFSIN